MIPAFRFLIGFLNSVVAGRYANGWREIALGVYLLAVFVTGAVLGGMR